MIQTYLSSGIAAIAVLLSASSVAAQAPTTADAVAVVNQLETARFPQPIQRQEFPLEGEDSAFKFSFFEDGNTIDNAAVLQLQVTKGQNQFLSTCLLYTSPSPRD